MKNFTIVAAALLLGAAALSSCNSLEVTLPKGPQGEQGIQGISGRDGIDGLSAYDVWARTVSEGGIAGWDETKTSVSDYFVYLKGADGRDGTDGKSAYELWKEYISSGDVPVPKDPETAWDPEKDSERDFYEFLTGADGADGLVPDIGENGNWYIGETDTGVPATGPRGEDGRTAYEVWKSFIEDGGDPGWPAGDVEEYHFFKYLKGEKGDTGAKGAKGDTPYIGSNGDWYISGTDTGIPATGPKGDTGAKGDKGLSAYEVWKGDVTSDKGLDNPGNGIYDTDKWPKDKVSEADFYDYLYGHKGDKGDQGLSAYEVWRLYIEGGDVDNPQDPGSKWDPEDNSEADFYLFLTGPKGDDGLIPYIGSDGNWWIGETGTGIPATGPKGDDGDNGDTPEIGSNGNWWIGSTDTGVPAKGKDGSEGTDGKSAYEIWKADVLSEEGLATPDNGVYDPSETPLWPAEAVSLADFWLYLRGRDGLDGKDGENAAAPAEKPEYAGGADADLYNLVSVRSLMKIQNGTDTTYEYVNPYSGGAAFLVTAPGPVIVPDCEVVFSDVDGNAYTRTSDGNGYIYLSREELPSYSGKAAAAVKPSSFRFNGRTVSDQSKIAATCIVPHKVELSYEMTGATLDCYEVKATGKVSRKVEGQWEESWGGVAYPLWDDSSRSGYKYFRSPSAMDAYQVAIGARPTFDGGSYNSVDALTGSNAGSVLEGSESRSVTSSDSMSGNYFTLDFGDGARPSVVEVGQQVYTIGSYNGKLTINKPQPDYGLKVTTSRRAHVPEIRYAGKLDISYETGRVQKPKEGDESTMINVKYTHYEVEIGKTRFSGMFDVSTFGQCYVEGKATRSGDTFGFTRYSTLEEYRAENGGKLTGTVSCKGTHEGNRIDNYKAVSGDTWTDLLDIYDGMSLIVGSTVSNNVSSAGYLKCGKVSYRGWTASFSYRDGSYTCRLSGGEAPSGNIQAVYMGHLK